MTPEDEISVPDSRVVDALPGIVWVAAAAWARTAVWGLETSVRIGNRVARAAVSQDAAAELIGDVRAGVRDYARELLGIADLDDRVRQLMPGSSSSTIPRRGQPISPGGSLRARGAELLRLSADVNGDDSSHPAYERILTELAPDEGRILRLLMLDGPQPSVDVRAANLIGVGSQLVAQGLNMLGAEAGCRYVDRVPLYLNNLNRLGLIWFSHDPIEKPTRYQVLEAQPGTMRAIRDAGRAKTVHRSIRLTPFGRDFVDVCLPVDIEEIEALSTS
jgi:abortive infection alpha-like protein